MHDDHTPKHRRHLPPGVEVTPEEDRFLQDLRTDAERAGRRVRAKGGWTFPVPRRLALLFDALPSPFTVAEAVRQGGALGVEPGDVDSLLREMQHLELVSVAPGEGEGPSFVKHPETRNWF